MRRSNTLRSPVVTISTDYIEATMKKIEENGGRIILGKTPFGNRGFTAYFRDTEGNTLGLWQVVPPKV